MKRPRTSLDAVFNPKSVAVAGASPGKQGQLFLDSFLASGYKGKIFAINSKGQEVSGMKAYKSIKDLPESVDYVVCCIPAPAVPQLIRDCGAKGVKVVSVFTAGFSEIGTDEGKRLEKEVAQASRETGVRVIGPNCLGVYAPGVGFSYTTDFPKQAGTVAFLCQSGGNSVYTTRAAGYRGVRFSKVISYGNACDINECELLEYLIQDDETKIVAIYIEGVRNGPRFYRALTELTKTKPVVILKAGYTQAGAKAAASHTGSLAGSDEVWDELLQQAGAIRVYSLEELVDVMVTLYLLPTPQGRRVGIFGGGGGATVLGADDWSKHGFVLPPLPKVIKEELRTSVPTEAGLILSNPIDLSGFAYSERFYSLIRRLLTYRDFIDLSVIHIGFGQAAWFSTDLFDAQISVFKDAVVKLKADINRPLALVIQYLITGWDWQKGVDDIQQSCAAAGVPVYHSMVSAAKAIDRVLRYYEKRQTAGEYAGQ
ncbi:MAG: CoA-binding protein [Dehalococcoidia bacterium]|nr:CoA-binding protein [Dehalococcoidia bacterium]